ncbi:MAG TPA: serine protease [Polyangia bacterium]|nr:serine protease [Polyangia bacterium]
MRPWWGVVGLALAAASCAREPAGPAVGTHTRPVVYGIDGRTDYYAHPNPLWRALVRDSVCALVPSSRLDTSDPMNVRVVADTLGHSQNLCADQRFWDQPAAADCSGTLIDDDLVLTAGHCVPDRVTCSAVRYLFHYYEIADGQLATITQDDVFSCQSLVVQMMANPLDYAIVQLDRPAVPAHRPAPTEMAAQPLARGTPLALLGFPNGLPAKIDCGGQVIGGSSAAASDQLAVTVDSFAGDSGGGLFDADGRVVAIAVAGLEDYVRRGSCYVVNVVPSDGSQGTEVATYVGPAVAALCGRGWPSSRLCGPSGGEPDGGCAVLATPEACPSDCPQREPALPDAGPDSAPVGGGGGGDQGGCTAAPGLPAPPVVGLLAALLLSGAQAHYRGRRAIGNRRVSERNRRVGLAPGL